MPSLAPLTLTSTDQVAYTRDAPTYDSRTSGFDTYRRQLVDLLPLQRGDVVLDVGCGTGLCFEQVRGRVGAEGAIIGVDASREMLAMAAARVADRGWNNVVLVQAPVERAVLPAVADHALFCATHDVLQSADALDNVLAHVRDGGTVAATGGKWAAPWAIALNAGHPGAARAVRARLRRVRPAVGSPGAAARAAAGAGDRDGRGLPRLGHGAAAGGAARVRAPGARRRRPAPGGRHAGLTRSLPQAPRSPAAAVSAARIAAVGPVRPVISSTCSTAWCSSTSSPPATRHPAAAPAAASAVGHGA